MQGPITRARAQQLDLQVRSNLVNCFSELTHSFMHVLLIRNNGEDQQGLGEGQEVKEEKLGRPHQGGVNVQLDFDSTSDLRTSLHQN
jgi:CTP-dependent riboflavin kinase